LDIGGLLNYLCGAVMKLNTVICGKAEDVLKTFPDGCVNMCVTSPPYWAFLFDIKNNKVYS